MQLSFDVRIPDGLLAANALLNEKPHQGVPSWNLALHQGIDERNSTAAIGLRASAQLNRIWPRYTGKERDTESELDYFVARYYGSNIGRFMSPDWASNPVTIPFANIYDPQSLNLYSYTGNNPLNRFDPDGHLDCSFGPMQDAACAVTAVFKAIWHLLSSSSDSSSSQQTNVQTSQHDNYTPTQMGRETPTPNYPRTITLNTGYSLEFGLKGGFAQSDQISAGLNLQGQGHTFGAQTSGGFDDHNYSPDPRHWVFGAAVSAGPSITLSNGSEEQLGGSSHAHNLFGIGYSYTGSFWKPGVYGITFPLTGLSPSASRYDVNTQVLDSHLPYSGDVHEQP